MFVVWCWGSHPNLAKMLASPIFLPLPAFTGLPAVACPFFSNLAFSFVRKSPKSLLWLWKPDVPLIEEDDDMIFEETDEEQLSGKETNLSVAPYMRIKSFKCKGSYSSVQCYFDILNSTFNHIAIRRTKRHSH